MECMCGLLFPAWHDGKVEDVITKTKKTAVIKYMILILLLLRSAMVRTTITFSFCEEEKNCSNMNVVSVSECHCLYRNTRIVLYKHIDYYRDFFLS